jgi:hypothetical protein
MDAHLDMPTPSQQKWKKVIDSLIFFPQGASWQTKNFNRPIGQNVN